MANQWTNEDGLNIRYGQEQAAPPYPTAAQVLRYGSKRQLVLDFNYDELPQENVDSNNDGTLDAWGNWEAHIPAGAYITAAFFVVTTAFAGAGTETFDFGLYEQDGTAIAAQGLDAAVAITALGANEAVDMDGTYVRGTVTPAADAYVKVAASAGTVTAGAGKLVIEYIFAGV